MSIGLILKIARQFLLRISCFSSAVWKSLRTKVLQASISRISTSSAVPLWLIGCSWSPHWCEGPRKASLQLTQTGAAGRVELNLGPSEVEVVHPEVDFLSLTLGTWFSLAEDWWVDMQKQGRYPQMQIVLSGWFMFLCKAAAPGVITEDWLSGPMHCAEVVMGSQN